MYSLILLLHVAIGVVALATYWIAGLSRKGSRVHRSAGKVFMLAMLVILATSLVFVGRMVLHGQPMQAAFFAYLIVISGTALATGWLSLRWKTNHRRYHGPWYQALGAFNMLCGLSVLGLGMAYSQVVLMGFSLVGMLRGGQMLRLSRQAESPRWHLREHLGSMIGNGVAVHVAFLLVGLKRLLPPGYEHSTELLGWLLPLAVASIAGVVFGHRYAAPVTGSAKQAGDR